MGEETFNTYLIILERFSLGYRKTKTKVMTLANHKGHKITVNQSKLQLIACSRREVQKKRV